MGVLDVQSNGNRSVFAEFMVGKALGCLDQPRVEWDSVDLHYGEFGIEVKASAACQLMVPIQAVTHLLQHQEGSVLER